MTTTKTPHVLSASSWQAYDDDGTGTLPCVLSPHVTGYGNFYVAQCNNYADALLIAQAPQLLKVAELLNEAVAMDARAPAAHKARIAEAMMLAVEIVGKLR